MKKTIYIEGMHCEHCSGRVFDTLSNIEGIDKTKVNLKKKNAVIKCQDNVTDEQIKTAITKLGFEVIEIK